MKKVMMIFALVLGAAVSAQAYVPSDDANLVQQFEKDGVLTKVYRQTTYADQTVFCSQTITLKYDAVTKELLSSDSKEVCHRL